MSRLSRHIKRALKEISVEGLTVYEVVYDFIADEWHSILDKCMYYEVRAFLQNLPWFVRQAWGWRSWDSHYNIILFARSLEESARNIKKYGNHVNSEKCSRKCMFAAALLKQAYGENLCISDKSYRNWHARNPIKFLRIPDGEHKGLSEMTHDYTDTKEYSEKMWKVIHKRISKIEEDRKEFAWKFIHKNIQNWWD